ncbi:SAF domain-containing protein [Metabacillus fastidiosus]|uniref:SAF domain-containing protein n=1 Tax=Metabacillus fastidiosus TaxID=1458 RepID=UPI003D2DEDF7
MKIRQRNKNLLYAGGIGALTVAIISSVVVYSLYVNWKEDEHKKMTEYENKISSLEEWATKQNRGFRLKEEVKAGTKIDGNMVEQVLLADKTASEDILSLGEIEGRFAKVDMKPSTLMTDSVLFKEEATPKDLRDGEYSFITLAQKLKKDDFIDVRIQFPNGNDYILLSKKKVKNIEGETIWFDMKENEILTMSSGIVDAYLENAIIYTMPYVDPYIQDEAIVTYPVKENVKQLIIDSPNILQVAKDSLASRGREALESNLKTMEAQDKSTYKQQKEQQQQIKEKQKEALQTQEEVFEESTEPVSDGQGDLNQEGGQ